MSDPRALLLPQIVAARTPAQLAALAVELERIAAELRARSAAMRADGTRAASQRLAPTRGTGGRPGAMTVYLEAREERGRSEATFTLRIGRGIYDAYQRTRPDPRRPLRLAPQIVGDTLRLVEDPSGYAVTVNAGGVRVNASGSRDELAALTPGRRYPAEALAGAIVVRLD